MLLRGAARSRPAAARAAGSRLLCSNALTTPGASGEVGEVAEPAMDKGTISQARPSRPPPLAIRGKLRTRRRRRQSLTPHTPVRRRSPARR